MANKSVASIQGKGEGIQAPEYKVSGARKVDTFVKTSPQQMGHDRTKQIASAIDAAIGLADTMTQKDYETTRAKQIASIDETFALINDLKKDADNPNNWRMSDTELWQNQQPEVQMMLARKQGAKQTADLMLEVDQQLNDDPSILLDPARLKATFDQHRRNIESTDSFLIARDATFNNALDAAYNKAVSKGIAEKGRIFDEGAIAEITDNMAAFQNGTLYDQDGQLITTLDQWTESNPYLQRLSKKGLDQSELNSAYADAWIAQSSMIDATASAAEIEQQIQSNELKLLAMPKTLMNGVTKQKVSKAIADNVRTGNAAITRMANELEAKEALERQDIRDNFDSVDYDSLSPEGKTYYNTVSSLEKQLDPSKTSVALAKHTSRLENDFLRGTGVAALPKEKQIEYIYAQNDLMLADKKKLEAKLSQFGSVETVLRTDAVRTAKNNISTLLKPFEDDVSTGQKFDAFPQETYFIDIQRNFDKRLMSEILALQEKNGTVTDADVYNITDKLYEITQKKIKEDQAQVNANNSNLDTDPDVPVTAALPEKDTEATRAADEILAGLEEGGEEVTPESTSEFINNLTNVFGQ